jgi:hypothetical protein
MHCCVKRRTSVSADGERHPRHLPSEYMHYDHEPRAHRTAGNVPALAEPPGEPEVISLDEIACKAQGLLKSYSRRVA